jgi:dynein heavy chain
LATVSAQSTGSPFFSSIVEVDLNSSPAVVVMKPSLSEIQDVINRAAISILRASKRIVAWGVDRDAKGDLASFFEELAGEKEVVKYVLMLTGALLGAKLELDNYLETFSKYSHLWSKNMQNEYNDFLGTDPSLEDFDDKLCWYIQVENEVDRMPMTNEIGVILMQLGTIKQTLTSMTSLWKSQYTSNLMQIARDDLNLLVEYMGNTTRKFNMTVESLDDVRKVMGMMHEVIDKESVIEWDFGPLEEKYDLLQR